MKRVLKQGAILAIWSVLFWEILFNPEIRAYCLVFLSQFPAFAPVALVAVQILLASFILPCSPLAVLAGVLWGFEIGVFYSAIATMLSSLWTFFLGRYVLKDWILAKLCSDWCANILRLVDVYQWKASMIAHANPVFPGSSLGYAFGASTVSAGSFAFGVVMGTLPLQLMMVGFGHVTSRTAGNLTSWLVLAVLGLGMALLIYKLIVPQLLSVTAAVDQR